MTVVIAVIADRHAESGVTLPRCPPATCRSLPPRPGRWRSCDSVSRAPESSPRRDDDRLAHHRLRFGDGHARRHEADDRRHVSGHEERRDNRAGAHGREGRARTGRVRSRHRQERKRQRQRLRHADEGANRHAAQRLVLYASRFTRRMRPREISGAGSCPPDHGKPERGTCTTTDSRESCTAADRRSAKL